MPLILVTPLSAVEETIRRYRPSHMITLLSPEHMIDTPQGIEPARHLKLGVNDVPDVALSEMPPGENHVKKLIAFGRGWDAKAPILVHCWAGVSRSMASAFTLLCDRLRPGMEHEIAQAMRARAPHAFPNPLIVRHADTALGREGRMIAAAQSIGRGMIVSVGECVEFPLDPDLL
ncbi:MAG: hypothetical protein WBQ17_07670 [Rhizomicrobium sp.]|jgi:predicted protein tyrosine phosphatase